MRRMRDRPLRMVSGMFVTAILASAGCTTEHLARGCDLPPLTEDQVRSIADHYLSDEELNPAFRAKAQTRVKSIGCRYSYEEKERLDLPGLGVTVIINREGKVESVLDSD